MHQQMHAFFRCPNEIRQQILMHLPLTPALLSSLGLACKAVFSELLLHSHKFARLHVMFHLRASSHADLWEFLHAEGIRDDKWRAFPFSYRVALFGLILREPNWSKVYHVEDLTQNLMCYNRWLMPPATALRLIHTLLDAKFPINIQENRAFRWSARSGYLEVVRLLLSNPDVNPADQQHYAIASTPDDEFPEVVKLLLTDERIDPTAQNHLAIRWACDHDHLSTVQLLLADPRIDPGTNNNYVALQLLNKNHPDVVLDLLTHNRIDPSVAENSLLRTAADCGHVDIVRLLLADVRVDPAAETSSALALAAAQGRTEVVRILIQDGRSDPSTFMNHGIRLASEKGHLEVVKMLLEDERVNPSAQNQFAIKMACKNGHVEIVERLLQDVTSELSACCFKTLESAGVAPIA
ncbi:hypothetical protein HDU98_005418 [Podochytrium sp. JEL0797]|nr:hypothetical protein HDU98_005418 [Podochytrium sp. JEL0797]